MEPSYSHLMLLAPLLTAALGFFFGRKKTSAEAKKIDAEANNATYDGYRMLISQLQEQNKRLEDKVLRIEEKYENLEKKMHKGACIVENCPNRRRW